MRVSILVVLLLALASAAVALADRGDPQKRFTSADQTRAKSMLLRPSDLNAAFTARPSNGGGGSDFYCAALDESDLTLTGQAISPLFTATTEFVTSSADVYASRSDASASWRRGTSPAGQECVRIGVRSLFTGTPVRLVSFKRIAVPQRGHRTVAYRAIASQQGVRLYLDVVAMLVGRAEVGVIYITALSPPPSSELRRLTSLVQRRAEKAMRGS